MGSPVPLGAPPGVIKSPPSVSGRLETTPRPLKPEVQRNEAEPERAQA